MATLRDTIAANIQSLTDQITAANTLRDATIYPLQQQLDVVQAELVQFAAFLDIEVSAARKQFDTVLTGLAAQAAVLDAHAAQLVAAQSAQLVQ